MTRFDPTHPVPCVYLRHGSYWLVKRGKWARIGATLQEALAEYGKRESAPKGGMAELIERVYQAHAPKVSANTRRQYRLTADTLKRKFAEFTPNEVKSRHVAQLKLDMADTPNQANRLASFLRIVFSQAVEWQLLDSNPAVGIRRHDEGKRTRYITDAEWQAIHDAAKPRIRVIMRLQFATGQRIGDVISIRRSQIGDDGITFRQQKTGAKLLVRWTPELKSAIADALALHVHPALTLFVGRKGKPPTYGAIYQAWMAAAHAAGVEDVRPNDLRAKAATDVRRQGGDATKLLGHTSTAMTDRYLRDRETPSVDGPTMGRRSAK